MIEDLRWVKSTKYGRKYVLQYRTFDVMPDVGLNPGSSDDATMTWTACANYSDWQDVPCEELKAVWCEHMDGEPVDLKLYSGDYCRKHYDVKYCPVCGKERPMIEIREPGWDMNGCEECKVKDERIKELDRRMVILLGGGKKYRARIQELEMAVAGLTK